MWSPISDWKCGQQSVSTGLLRIQVGPWGCWCVIRLEHHCVWIIGQTQKLLSNNLRAIGNRKLTCWALWGVLGTWHGRSAFYASYSSLKKSIGLVQLKLCGNSMSPTIFSQTPTGQSCSWTKDDLVTGVLVSMAMPSSAFICFLPGFSSQSTSESPLLVSLCKVSRVSPVMKGLT